MDWKFVSATPSPTQWNINNKEIEASFFFLQSGKKLWLVVQGRITAGNIHEKLCTVPEHKPCQTPAFTKCCLLSSGNGRLQLKAQVVQHLVAHCRWCHEEMLLAGSAGLGKASIPRVSCFLQHHCSGVSRVYWIRVGVSKTLVSIIKDYIPNVHWASHWPSCNRWSVSGYLGQFSILSQCQCGWNVAAILWSCRKQGGRFF